MRLNICTDLSIKKSSSADVLFKEEQELFASGRSGGKFLSGQGRVQKLAVAGHVALLRRIQIPKSHGPAGEVPVLPGFLDEDDDAMMAWILVDAAKGRLHGCRWPLQHLHEPPVLVKQQSGGARPGVAFPGLLVQVAQPRLAEKF